MNSIGDSAGASLPVLCGPTASGKSALALRLAEAMGASIISADSRQVYRGFDIGTAKPDALDRARVPHYGIDVAAPDERYTAADWAGSVPQWTSDIESASRKLLIVGGTGFFLRALFEPLFEEPQIDPERRAAVRQALSGLPADEIRRWCEAIDPARASLGPAQRERALEVALITGRRISELHRERSRAPAMTARYLVLDPGPELAGTIATRVDRMIAGGWLDEVRSLAVSVDAGARAWTATGYDVLRRVVVGDLPLERGRDLVVIATRQYAKRQRTWFRHQLTGQPVLRLDPREPEAFESAVRWFEGKEARQ